MLSGCPPPPDVLPDAGLPWTEACGRLAAAQCRCPGASADCTARQSARCLTVHREPGAAVTPEQLAACAAVFGCDDEVPPEACRFTGRWADGTSCLDDGQCASGTCAHHAAETCGTCVTRSATLPCFVDPECPLGSFCRFGRCVAGGALDAGCDDDNPCKASLQCSDGTCRARPVVDAGDDDAGSDAGSSDAGAPDAGDAGPQDAGPTAEDCLEPDGGAPSSTYPARMPSVPTVTGQVVLTQPKIVAITFKTDPYVAAIDQLVSSLGASSLWRDTTSEYGVGPLTALPPIHSTDDVSATVDGSDIRAYLQSKIPSGAPWPASDGKTIYLVIIPLGTQATLGGSRGCVNYLGYHGTVDVGGVATPFAVVVECRLQPPTATIVHEAIEAATDPFYDDGAGQWTGIDVLDGGHLAWGTLVNNSEVADLCDRMPYARVTDPTLGVQVQRTWSNASMVAFHGPCAPVSGPYLAAVPEQPDTVSIYFESSTQPTKGISIPMGSKRTISVDLLSDGPVDGPWRVTAYDLGTWKGQDPELKFSFDKQLGVNGDQLQLTLTPLRQDPFYGAEPFFLLSRRGRIAHLWFGVVGNP